MTPTLRAARPTSRLLALAAIAATALGWRATTAAADPKPPAGSYGVGAPGSASPSSLPPDDVPPPVASGQRPPHFPDFAAPAPPETPSEKPARSEWASAPAAEGVRITDPGCKAQRIREWYRVQCGDDQVSVVTGSKSDLEIVREGEGGAALVFPVRRGDTRLVVFAFLWKWGFVQDAVLSVQWLEGDPAPLITIVGIPHGGL